jgi:hypothetical protein
MLSSMDARLDPTTGAELLAQLGFLHVPGRPLVPRPAYLFVALRRRPTLEHFDPERVDYWTEVDARGVRTELDRSVARVADSSFAWGLIRVVDRKSISNEWVSFGGQLSGQRIDDVEVAVFSSDAPIAARGGHSQGLDPAAAEMAAFVARLRAAAGSDRAFEAELAQRSPLALYSAFVVDELARHHDRRGNMIGSQRLVDLLATERRSLQRSVPTEWAMGNELARRLLRQPVG